MDENTRTADATNEHALDANESWGQATDASHPDSASEGTLPSDLGTDPALAGDPGEDDADEVDGPPLT